MLPPALLPTARSAHLSMQHTETPLPCAGQAHTFLILDCLEGLANEDLDRLRQQNQSSSSAPLFATCLWAGVVEEQVLELDCPELFQGLHPVCDQKLHCALDLPDMQLRS